MRRRMLAARRRSGKLGSFDFGRCETDAIAFLKNLIGGRRLTIDADQVVAGTTVVRMTPEKVSDCKSRFDLDVVGKSAAVVVNHKNAHVSASVELMSIIALLERSVSERRDGGSGDGRRDPN